MKNFVIRHSMLLLLLILTVSETVVAQEIIQFYSGIRYLGMGNTSISVTNDETAIAVNPAALGRLRDIYGTIFDPEIEANIGASDVYHIKAFTQPFRFEAVIPSVAADPNTYYHARAHLMPSFVAKNFGIAFLANDQFNAEANTAGTTVNTFYRDDMALLLGYNLRLFEGRIKIGVTGKVISRIEINESALSTTGPLDMPTLGTLGKATEGLGVGADAGIILAAPWDYIPTLTAVVHDVGGTKFDKSYANRLSSSTVRPNQQNQDIDVGMSLFPIHTNYIRSSWAIEYHGVTSAATEPDKAKLIHAGVEFNFGDVFFVRAGYNQRYWTAGLELASERFQIQLASYGEEIGSSSTTLREDRRYVSKFSYRF
jgi:hypothetical protein